MSLTDWSGVAVSRTTPIIRRIVDATFPDYRGRKIKVRQWTGARQLDNYWSGGSRSYYVAIRVNDGAVSDFGTDNPFLASAHDKVDLPEGVILVERSIFCGKESGLTIWTHAPAAPALLGDGLA
jgi:hypothetical protein